MSNENTSDEHSYPHQINPGETVSPDDLRRDIVNNPSAYHPGLHQHINAFLGRTAGNEVGIENSEVVKVPIIVETIYYDDYPAYKSNIDDLLQDPRYSPQQIADAFIAEDKAYVVADNLSRLHGLDASTANKLIDSNSIRDVIRHLDSFEGVDHKAIARLVFELEWGGELILNIDKFHQLTHQEIVDIALDIAKSAGIYSPVETIIEGLRLSLLKSLSSKTAYDLAEKGAGYFAIENPQAFAGLDNLEFAHYLFSRNGLNDVPRDLWSTLAPKISAEEIAKRIDMQLDADEVDSYWGSSFDDYIEFLSSVPKSRHPQVLITASEMLDKYITKEGVLLIRSLLRGEDVSLDAQLAGVTEKGDAGLDQLRVTIKEITDHIMHIEMTPDIEARILRSPFLRDILSKISRFDKTEFGETSDESLVSLMNYRRIALEDGRLVPMPPEYENSQTYQIATVESKKDRDTWTQDAQERYVELRHDIQDAITCLRGPQAFKGLFEILRDEVDRELEAIALAIEYPTLPDRDYNSQAEKDMVLQKKVENLKRQYKSLQTFVSDRDNGAAQEKRFILNSPANFRRAFEVLEPHKNLHQSIRQIVIAWALRKNSTQISVLEDLPEEPSIDSLAAVHSFIDHIVNQETYGQYFDNKKAASKFRKISSTRALEDAMDRYQQMATKTGTTTLQCISTRGLMLELSGHIGEACWASKYDSIAETMPNMSAVIMKQNPGTSAEKLVGSALLIETTDEKGNPTLVLRGVNPTENYINKTDVGEFYGAIIDYAIQTARVRNMQPAIVIDDHSGGSATNRPALFGYLRAQLSGTDNLKKVEVNPVTTTFNGYDITNDTYRLPVAKSSAS